MSPDAREALRERDIAQRNVIAILTQLGGSITLTRATLQNLDTRERLIETHVDVATGDTTLRLVDVGPR